MTESDTARDLRLLGEIADEIEKHHVVAMPGSLRSMIRTVRGRRVGRLLENLANDLATTKWNAANKERELQRQIDGLRNEMQTMTDAALAAERKA